MHKHSGFRLGLYEKAMPSDLSFRSMLIAARTADFDFVEMSVDETDYRLSRLDWSSVKRQSLLRQMADEGLRFETMCLSGHRKYPLGSPDAATRDKSLRIMQQAIDLSFDLGIRIIQLAGYDTYYDTSSPETRAWFLENLNKSSDMASEAGVILAFETMETDFMNTVGKAMSYVDQVNSPYLQIYPDSGNLTNASMISGQSILDDFQLGQGHIAALHLKETVPGKFREIPYGTGHVNFSALIQLALSCGVRRFTSEFWYLGEENWQDNLSGAASFLRSKFPADTHREIIRVQE